MRSSEREYRRGLVFYFRIPRQTFSLPPLQKRGMKEWKSDFRDERDMKSGRRVMKDNKIITFAKAETNGVNPSLIEKAKETLKELPK